MKKRGEEMTLWSLIELVGVVFVGYMAIHVAVAYAQGTIYEKLNIAENLAMEINSLISLPGDAYIIDKNIHGYSLYFADNRIEVYEEVFDPVKGIYYFPKTENMNLALRLNKPKQVVISKINGEIKVSEEIPLLTQK